tara:strand:+ start:3755 stop:4327 length:573 start_codon:yes stop_codon:yes gene_type:complete
MRDSLEQLSKGSVYLHWFVALNVLVLTGVGIFMTQTKSYFMYPVHKSFGTIMFVFITWRLVRRLMIGFPPMIGRSSVFEKWLARITHSSLLIASILMPISGMTMSVLGGRGLAIFGFSLVDPNMNPADPTKIMPLHKGLAHIAHEAHHFVAWIFLALIVLHVLAAMKHHFFYRDPTLRRMLGKKVELPKA